jgi:tRNA A37 threonylcarbamoyladenosine biosynthesis protein TsaE
MKKIFQNISKDNIAAVVELTASLIKPGSILFFDGDPGTGKTYLISEILKQHNISMVSSPTFALHHRYESGCAAGMKIDDPMDRSLDAQVGYQNLIFHHFDLYRVESIDELETIGLWELLSESESERATCFLIEWGQRFPRTLWPMNFKKKWIEITPCELTDARNYIISDE